MIRNRRDKTPKIILIGGQIPINESSIMFEQPYKIAVEFGEGKNKETIPLQIKQLKFIDPFFSRLFDTFLKLKDLYNTKNFNENTSKIKDIYNLVYYISYLTDFVNKDRFMIDIENANFLSEINNYIKKQLFFTINNTKSLWKWITEGYFVYKKFTLDHIKLLLSEYLKSEMVKIISKIDLQDILTITRLIIDYNSGCAKKKIFIIPPKIDLIA